MLRVGVKLPAATGRIGDYLAEVSALEAAGADAIWQDATTPASHEPWILLGAISAVTHRVRLGAMVDSGAEWPPAVDSLARLSGGRAVVGLAPGRDLEERVELIRIRRSDSSRIGILIACGSHAEAKRSPLLADGVIVPGGHQEVRAPLPARRSASAFATDGTRRPVSCCSGPLIRPPNPVRAFTRRPPCAICEWSGGKAA